MPLDLTRAGAKVLAGDNAGTATGDAFSQHVRDLAMEAAVGSIADAAWGGSGDASILAILKAIALSVAQTGVLVDGSGTVTTGGSAQQLFSGSVPIHGYLVQNLSDDDLYISDVGTAAPPGGSPAVGSASILLAPGQMWVTPPQYIPPMAVSLYGATTGQVFVARRW